MVESGEFPEESEEKVEETELPPPPQPPLQPILPTAATGYVTCPICGETVSAKGRYVHFRNAHPQLDYNEYKDKFKPAPVPPEKREEGPPKPIEIETIEEAIAFIKDRLQSIHGVGSNDRIIISALQDDPTPLRDPNYLHQFIKSIAPKAYDSHLSMFVIKPLYVKFPNLPQMVDRFLANTQAPQFTQPYMFMPQPQQSYPLYMTQPQPTYSYPPYQITPPTTQPPTLPTPITAHPPPPPSYQWYQQAPQYPQAPTFIPPPQPQPQLEDRLRALEERLTRMIEEKIKPKEEKHETYIEIERPVKDKDGNYVLDESGKAITEKMRVPASQAGFFAKPEEDVEEKVLRKLKIYQELFGTGQKGLDESRIKQIIQESLPKEELKPEDITRAAAEAAASAIQQYIKTQEKEEKEEERFKRLEQAIRESLSARTVEGYKEDAYRVVGQGISELASTIRERRPVEVIIREGAPLLLGVAPPKQIEKGAEEAEKGLIGLFEKRGWVVEG
jgi:hypothetical protein